MIIRPMVEADIQFIAIDHRPPWTTPEVTEKRWRQYLNEQSEGIRYVAVIEDMGTVIGYGSLWLKSEYPHFANIPEIADVWIYDGYRAKGYGTKLLQYLEQIAKAKGFKEIGIGVGLYTDYGPAQRLYYTLGYKPDGNGVTYKLQQAVAGESYPLDDDFILWFKKPLN